MLRNLAYFSPEFIAESRRGCYQRLRFRIGRCCSLRTLRIADEIVCPSATMKEAVLRTSGISSHRIRVAYFGCEPPQDSLAFADRAREQVVGSIKFPQKIETKAILDQHRRIILHVGHYSTQKNLCDLMQAVETMHQTGEQVTLVLTANITNYNGASTALTRREVALARRLADRRLLLETGPVDKLTVWKLLALADVFAFPSTVESFGHPLLEAQAMNVPVVASDTDVHREIAGQGALYYELGKPEDLADKLAIAFNDDRTAQQLIAAGRSNLAKFSWDDHAKTLCDAIVGLTK